MVVYAGQGDARRSMALLWRSTGSRDVRPGPGPRAGLSVDMIVDAAIEVADADGLAGLSMRAVGERLGRTAMALYTHVPSKSELVDLMYDHAHSELRGSYDLEDGWRVAVTSWARDLREFYLRHPWVLQVSQARPVLGPNEFAALETVVRILSDTGLAARVLRSVVGALFSFVRGAAQTIVESRQAETTTGMSEDTWWYARSGWLEEFAPDFAERFPMLTRLESEKAYQFEDETMLYVEQEAGETFEVGLAVWLDGVDATIASTPA